MKTFIVSRSPGSAWIVGTPTRQQPYWDEHAAFMDKVFADGYIILGGPYADSSGALLIVEAEDETVASHLFDDDPWTKQDILSAGTVKEWLIFLDGRSKT